MHRVQVRPAVVAYRSRGGRSICAAAVSGLLALSVAGCGGDAQDATTGWLVDGTPGSGVNVDYASGDDGQKRLPRIMGGGVAVFDADLDGDLDLYFVRGHGGTLDRDGGAGGDGATVNRFLQQQPDGRFVDRTEVSGLGDPGYGMGVAVGDIDRDGLPDVLVTNFGPDQLYLNRGGGRFENATDAWGVRIEGFSASAAFCDFDADGWLDLFVTRYVEFDPELSCLDPSGRVDYCGPQSYRGVPDVLLLNDGGRGFVDVSAKAGIAARADHGLGVVCEDFDADGHVDVLVANDGDPNHLWLNQGDGTFLEDAVAMGMAYDQHGNPEAGMGVVAEDFDGDGAAEAFMTHLENETNTLYRPVGPSAFRDATGQSGLGAPSMPFTGFGVEAIDLELDGDLDLVVANGRVRSFGSRHPESASPEPWSTMGQPDQVFLNRDGRFEPMAPESCPACRRGQVSRGLSVGDLDGDGDLDAVVTHIDAPATLWRNEAPRDGRWLRVRAVDPATGGDAIGASLFLESGGIRQRRVVRTTAGYLSAKPAEVHFGVPEAQGPAVLEVRWPDGAREHFDVECLDCALTLLRGEGAEP